MALAALVSGANLVGSLVGGLVGNGKDEKKYRARARRVNAATEWAQQGHIEGWLLIGGWGGVPLPYDIDARTIPGVPDARDDSPGIVKAGYTSAGWGDYYDPIVKVARQNYDALKSRFSTYSMPGGNTSLAPVAGQGLPTIPNVPNVGNGTFANQNPSSQPTGLNGQTPTQTLSTTGTLDSITKSDTGLLWVGVAGVGAWILARKLKLI